MKLISILLFMLFLLVFGAEDYVPGTGVVIGIDLGTTYSCVAVFRGGRVEIIPNNQGNRVTPSWVAFSPEERLIGDTAKQVFHKMPSQTIFDIKRLMGRKIDDKNLREDTKNWPFKVTEYDGRLTVQVEFRGEIRYFTPQEISAMILRSMKEMAEMYLGTTVNHAVITVPAYFNDIQRHATKEAGAIAGLNVLRIINEPTAAAIAHGMDKNKAEESILIVYDLGGGTFDVSLLKVNGGIFEVLATAGDPYLGGEDFDNRVIQYVASKYERETSTTVKHNKRAMAKLRREVEKAKKTLSSVARTQIDVESFEGGNDLTFVLTRAKFEELNLDLFERTMGPVKKVLKDAGVEPTSVQDVILVGGSTRIPMIQQILKNFFGKSPRMGINPDEAVAYGAAIQAGIISGEVGLDNVIFIDVCPITLGIETIAKSYDEVGGVFSPIIQGNTPLPARKSEIYSTSSDNQRTVTLKVFQGVDKLTINNVLLGTFELSGIPPAARGVPQIEVVFEVDNNGMMIVSANSKESGNSASIVLRTRGDRLSEPEIDRMSEEINQMSTQDESTRHRHVKLNEIQSLIVREQSKLSTEDHMYSELERHAKWIESFGQTANIAQLQEHFNKIEAAIEAAEALATSITRGMKGSKYTSHIPGDEHGAPGLPLSGQEVNSALSSPDGERKERHLVVDIFRKIENHKPDEMSFVEEHSPFITPAPRCEL
ncbi:ATPase with role in protein import into the ER [Ceratobasidium sp. 423]|nr:ATPase with role in protein import into the ER [Ceratobasidium sp. 423]